MKIQEIQATIFKDSVVIENLECNLKMIDDVDDDDDHFDGELTFDLNEETEISTATSWPGMN